MGDTVWRGENDLPGHHVPVLKVVQSPVLPYSQDVAVPVKGVVVGRMDALVFGNHVPKDGRTDDRQVSTTGSTVTMSATRGPFFAPNSLLIPTYMMSKKLARPNRSNMSMSTRY